MELNDLSPLVITAILGLVILIIFFYSFQKQSGATKKRDTLLVCGPSGSGKTLLSYRLCLDKSPTTITSMRPSVLEFSSKNIPVVDFPGHPRLRTLLYTTYLEQSREIVFVIDASNVQAQAREAAEFIYDLFTNPLIDKVTKFHVVCNKNDVASARPPARVKLSLQQELEKIKKTRKSLEEADDASFVPLGREGKPFSFDQDSPVEIDFCGLSAKNDSVESIVESLGL
jgi:signal recognition particle receptor subunit beta